MLDIRLSGMEGAFTVTGKVGRISVYTIVLTMILVKPTALI